MKQINHITDKFKIWQLKLLYMIRPLKHGEFTAQIYTDVNHSKIKRWGAFNTSKILTFFERK